MSTEKSKSDEVTYSEEELRHIAEAIEKYEWDTRSRIHGAVEESAQAIEAREGSPMDRAEREAFVVRFLRGYAISDLKIRAKACWKLEGEIGSELEAIIEKSVYEMSTGLLEELTGLSFKSLDRVAKLGRRE